MISHQYCNNNQNIEIKPLEIYYYDIGKLDTIELTQLSNICDQFIQNHDFFVIGLDCEWKPLLKAISSDNSSRYNKTAILQLSSTVLCLVLRIIDVEILPTCILSILMDSNCIKVGVDILNDIQRLEKDFHIHIKSFLDLRMLDVFIQSKLSLNLNKTSSISTRQQFAHNSHSNSLKSLCFKYLNVIMDKSIDIRCSDWSKEDGLSIVQIEYAAWDACISCSLYHTMMSLIDNSESSSIHVNVLPGYMYENTLGSYDECRQTVKTLNVSSTTELVEHHHHNNHKIKKKPHRYTIISL